jgi:hypothetical protein
MGRQEAILMAERLGDLLPHESNQCNIADAFAAALSLSEPNMRSSS